MPRLLGSGVVVPIFNVPHRIHNETATFSRPLETLGRYQEDLDMFKMAEIIVGRPGERHKTITLITAKARQASRKLLQLIVADETGLNELLRGDSIEDIQDVGDGAVEVINQYDQPLQMNTKGDFGGYWLNQSVGSKLKALLSISTAGQLNIIDSSDAGTWVHADWSEVERNPNGMSIAAAKAVLASGAVLLPIQSKRLS